MIHSHSRAFDTSNIRRDQWKAAQAVGNYSQERIDPEEAL